MTLGKTNDKDIATTAATSGEEKEEKGGPVEKPVKPSLIDAIGTLFSFSDKYDIMLMLLGTLGSLATGAALPCFSILLAQVSSTFGYWDYQVSIDPSSESELVDQVNNTSLWFVVLGIAVCVCATVGLGGWSITGKRQAHRIKSALLESGLHQDLSYIDSLGGSATLNSYLVNECHVIQDCLGVKVSRLFQHLSTIVSGYIIAFVRGWLMTLVMLSVIPAFLIFGVLVALATGNLTKNVSAVRSGALSRMLELLENIRTVHSSTGENVSMNRCKTMLRADAEVGVKVGLVKGFLFGSGFFISLSSYALALWFGSTQVADGKDPESVINVLFAAILGGSSIALLMPLLHTLSEAAAALHAVFQVIHRGPSSRDATETLEEVRGDIALEDVNFSYPSRPDVIVLHSFNLKIQAGSRVALVGQSGSGKSTIISLLERFYQPTSGHIYLDGVDIGTLNIMWLRSQIALVQQEPVLFKGSIRENIVLGRKDCTDDEIIEVSKAANAHEFIIKLPNGYDSMVGERGTKLSGGQKQRIAIARAIIRNPKVLLLDEATSALDTKSERTVQKSLDNLVVGRTSITVAHRLSTIVHSDHIVAMTDGRVVEEGTHAQLLKLKGLYATMARSQNLGEFEDIPEETVLPIENSRVMPDAEKVTSHPLTTVSALLLGFYSTVSSFSLSNDVNVEKQVEERRKSNYIWRLAVINKKEALFGVVGIFAAACSGVVMPAYAFVLSKSMYSLYLQDISAMRSDINEYAAIIAGIAGAALIAATVMYYCFGKMGQRLAYKVRKLILGSLLRQDIGWFDQDQNSSGVLAGQISSDTLAIKGQFGDAMGLLFQNMSMIIGALVFAFVGNWLLTIVVVAATPVVIIVGVLTVIVVARMSSKEMFYGSNAQGRAVEAIGNIRTVTSLNAQSHIVQRFEEEYQNSLKFGYYIGIVEGGGFGIGQFCIYSLYGLAFWYGGQLITQGKINPDNVLNVFLPLFMALFAAGQAQLMFPDVAKGKAAAARVFQMIDREPRIDNMSDEGVSPLSCKGKISFYKVNFCYPTRPETRVLKSFTIEIPENSSMALVGESGSGKSTIVSLLERFYSPASGSILLDDVSIETFNIRWLRQQIGFVGQEPVLFNMTIKENIAYGTEDMSDEAIIQAAKVAHAHDFITEAVEGYDTLLGDGGISLSGGQKQRIAIARAILKDPKILLMDEATSALDSESEGIVVAALQKAMVGKTSIIIAHKLVTVENVDCIAVLDKGVIVEQGTHSQLEKKKGLYFELLKMQRGQ